MRNLLLILLVLVSFTAAQGQDVTGQTTGDYVPSIPKQEYVGGEHTPLFFTSAFGNTDTLDGNSGSLTTRWMQIGMVNADNIANRPSNKDVQKLNPEVFGLSVILTSTGDSVCIATARFEYAWDTTATPVWNADSTNVFIESGAYSHSMYGQGKYERIIGPTPSIGYDFILRIQRGGYIRFVFTTGTTLGTDAIHPDDTTIDWTFWGEN